MPKCQTQPHQLTCNKRWLPSHRSDPAGDQHGKVTPYRVLSAQTELAVCLMSKLPLCRLVSSHHRCDLWHLTCDHQWSQVKLWCSVQKCLFFTDVSPSKGGENASQQNTSNWQETLINKEIFRHKHPYFFFLLSLHANGNIKLTVEFAYESGLPLLRQVDGDVVNRHTWQSYADPYERIDGVSVQRDNDQEQAAHAVNDGEEQAELQRQEHRRWTEQQLVESPPATPSQYLFPVELVSLISLWRISDPLYIGRTTATSLSFCWMSETVFDRCHVDSTVLA